MGCLIQSGRELRLITRQCEMLPSAQTLSNNNFNYHQAGAELKFNNSVYTERMGAVYWICRPSREKNEHFDEHVEISADKRVIL